MQSTNSNLFDTQLFLSWTGVAPSRENNTISSCRTPEGCFRHGESEHFRECSTIEYTVSHAERTSYRWSGALVAIDHSFLKP